MSKTPFMPLWVSDFLGDTLDLDASEIGAYMLLLMAQWNRDGNSLPNDTKKLQRVARCGRNWPKVWGNIERYFDTDENGVYSKRLRLESQNVASKREVNARNGALGGKAKSLANKETVLANATNSLKRKPSIPEPEPDISIPTGIDGARDSVVHLDKSKKRKPETYLPDGWSPDLDKARRVMDEHSLSREEMNLCYKSMEAHAHANQRKQRDWDAAYRNWVIREIQYGNIGPSSKRRKSAGGQTSIWD